jgi:hypothetical protein
MGVCLGRVRRDGISVGEQGHPLAVRLPDRPIDGWQNATRGFHTLTFHMTQRPGMFGRYETLPVGELVAPAQFQQLNVKAWLMRRI